MCRAIKRHAAVALRRLIGRAYGEQQLALWSKLADRMVAVVGAIDAVVRTDMDAVRAAGEDAIPPGAQEFTAAIVDDDRMLAAREYIDVIFGIHGHAGRVYVAPSVGKLAPA